MRKLTHQELLARQQNVSELKLPFSVILNDVRSLYNVGSIFRTADGAGVEKIWLCGITGTPPQPKILKTALGAESSVPWEHRQDVLALIKELKNAGYQIVLLEHTEGGMSYSEFIPDAPVCLVLGNEINGISAELVDSCDAAIEIEMAGLKNSLNVTVAFGVIAYEFRKHLKQSNALN